MGRPMHTFFSGALKLNEIFCLGDSSSQAQNPLVRDYLSTLNASKSTLERVVLVCESTLYQSSALI